MRIKTLSLLFIISILSGSMMAQQTATEIAFTNYHRYINDGQKVKDLEKQKYIEEGRVYFSKNGVKRENLKGIKKSGPDCLNLLDKDGRFKDLIVQEQEIIDKNLLNTAFPTTWSSPVSSFLSEAYNRLWKIAEAYRKDELSTSNEQYELFLTAIVHYGKMEIGRPDVDRFHASCFALPLAAVEIYYCMLKQMDNIEAGKVKDQKLIEAADMLKTVALQSWTQPLRQDETDTNAVQVERFRTHVWWVGGNGLTYRPVLPVAFMYKSIPMVDVLAEVSQKCMSVTSQNTNKTSFWSEGFTADGAAWGHGKQCIIWGYPIDGTSSALNTLNILKGSPMARKLSRENVDALLNYFRGSSWYFYKGHPITGVTRLDMQYNLKTKPIAYSNMVKTLLENWTDAFTPSELLELKQLTEENGTDKMNNQKDGVYSGSRWFYNNDDLMKKNANYHLMVNMASMRCDGLESAVGSADEYNFFANDGATLFQRDGTEYRKVFGAWDITLTPGVTAREGMEHLTPVTNWRGYCSKFNFAGAATMGGENAVGGFIFEKLDASHKENINDKGSSKEENKVLYGVKAHKAYFILGDYFVALGAGISNLQPEMNGTIRTSIDQTVKEGEVVLLRNGKEETVADGVHPFIMDGKSVWVSQKNKFSYTILPEYTTNASFVCESKKADWIKMNSGNKRVSNLPTTANVLTLWADHGQKAINGTYGYVVYAGKTLPTEKLPFKVLRNDTTVQAIQSVDQKVTEVVFYKSSSKLQSKNLSLSVSAPCVALIEERGGQTFLTVTDPQMNADLKQLKLTFGKKEIVVNMPQGEFCGRQETLLFK